jgi:RNA polymerase sigma factor (sigma-70 family)
MSPTVGGARNYVRLSRALETSNVDERCLQAELVESGGSSAGLLLLYAQHRAELLRFLRARCGGAAEAEDVVQDLWVRLQTQCVGPVANGRAYLYRMANNLVLDRVREQRRRARRDQQWSEASQLIDPAAGEAAAPDPSPPDELIELEQRRQLESAVASLPEGARRAFSLHKVQGWSHAEVAAHLGISTSGVEKHIAVAMKHLRQLLQGLR